MFQSYYSYSTSFHLWDTKTVTIFLCRSNATISAGGLHMLSLDEFVKIYINASEEVKIQIEETLDSFETQPVSPAIDSYIVHITQ